MDGEFAHVLDRAIGGHVGRQRRAATVFDDVPNGSDDVVGGVRAPCRRPQGLFEVVLEFSAHAQHTGIPLEAVVEGPKRAVVQFVEHVESEVKVIARQGFGEIDIIEPPRGGEREWGSPACR